MDLGTVVAVSFQDLRRSAQIDSQLLNGSINSQWIPGEVIVPFVQSNIIHYFIPESEIYMTIV